MNERKAIRYLYGWYYYKKFGMFLVRFS